MRRTSPNRSTGKAAKSGRRAQVRDLALQPDALGVATRLAAGRLREAGIVLKPLLRSAGLSVSQINRKDIRIGVASQIKFLELAAEALRDPLLGFKLARDGKPRQIGLLHYVAASSETLGDALDRVQRYSSIANAGVVLRCFEAGNFTIALHYAGVAQTFRSATDGKFRDMAYPLLQGFNGPPSEPDHRPFRSSTLGRVF